MISEEEDLPVPDCCTECQRSGLVRLSMPEVYWDGEENAAPVWTIAHFSFDIEVAFCPFGGHPLPKVRRRQPSPEPICRPSMGNYYDCRTCGQPAHECSCLSPEKAWETFR